MLFQLLAYSAMLVSYQAPGAALQQQDEEDIVVTGSRPQGSGRDRVEEPYPERMRAPIGSRIARRIEQRPFRTVATETGLAGLVGVAGGGMDGTGGSSHAIRSRAVTECVAADQQVSEAVACILFRVDRHTQAGEYAPAAEALAPLLARRHLTAAERYYVGHYAYALAEATADHSGRARALAIMLQSGRLPADQRGRAERVLASLTSRAQ